MARPTRFERASDAAITHLNSRDLAELWVPDVLNLRDVMRNSERLRAMAADRLIGLEEPDSLESVAIPKNHYFVRRGSLLTPPDRVAYHAALVDLQPRVNRRLHDGVLSSRSSRSTRYLFANPTAAWLRWQNRARKTMDRPKRWVIRTDLTAFFDSIRHEILADRLVEVGASDQTISTVLSLLERWAAAGAVGIPQGPDISRMLGNLYLTPLDDAMKRRGRSIHYSRYMDDIIVVGPRRDVIDTFQEMEDITRGLGIAVSSSKTSLKTGKDAIAGLSDPELASLNLLYAMGRRRRDVVRRMRVLVREALDPQSESLDTRRTRFALRRLAKVGDSNLDRYLLKNLEYFAPAAPLVCRYLQPRMNTKAVADGLAKFLADRDRCLSDYLSTWIMATIVDSAASVHPEWSRYALDRLDDADASRYERTMAMSVAGMGRDKKAVRYLRDVVTGGTDGWEGRAAVVGLARARQPRPRRAPSNFGREKEFVQWAIDHSARRTPSPLPATW